MQKFLFLLLCLLLPVTLCSAQTTKVIYTQEIFKGKVKSVIETRYSVKEKHSGNINIDSTYQEIKDFNEQGELISVKVKRPSHTADKHFITFYTLKYIYTNKPLKVDAYRDDMLFQRV